MLTAALLLAHLNKLLVSRVKVTEAQRATFVAGTVQGPGTVVSPKVLLVLSGRVEYVLNDQRFDLSAGVMLHRPARSIGRWRVTRSCEFLWCEFSCAETLGEGLTVKVRDVQLERASLERVRLLSSLPDAPAGLTAEGEMKAVLSRFLTTASEEVMGPVTSFVHDRPAARATRPAVAVREAATWISERFTEQDVIKNLHDRVGLSRDHFRREFVRHMGLSARAFLTHLRMRTARFYLLRTDMGIKEIAARVGYADPLYFSRHYRSFHGHSPRALRDDRTLSDE